MSGGATYIPQAVPQALTELTDTPGSYASQALKILRVNSGETGIEFVTSGASSTDPVIYAEDYCAFDGVTDDTANWTTMMGTIAATGGYRRIVCPYGKTALASGEFLIDKDNIIVDDLSVKLENSASGVTYLVNCTGSNVVLNRPVVDGNGVNNSALTYSGVLITGDDSKVLGGHIHDVTHHGVILDGGSAGLYRCIVHGNFLENIGFRGIRLRHNIECEVSKNWVVSTGGHGIDVARGTIAGTYNNARCRISENYINKATPPTTFSPHLGGAETGFFIALDLGAHGISVLSNVCWDNRNSGAGFDGIGLGQDGTNDPYDNTINDNQVFYAAGFGIDATTHSVVDGNYVYKPASYGIVAVQDAGGNFAGTSITNNLIVDAVSRGITAYSLVGSATFHNLKVEGNTIQEDTAGLTTNGVYLDSTNATFTATEVSHNSMKDATNGLVTVGTAFTDLVVKDNIVPDPIIIVASSDTTPSVLGGDKFYVNNALVTTITSFDNPFAGQEITVFYHDGITTLNATGNIYPTTTTPAVNTSHRYVYCSTDSKWYEV